MPRSIFDQQAEVRQISDASELFAQAKTKQSAIRISNRNALELARDAGGILVKAKALCVHGTWEERVRKEADIAPNQAWKYMQIWKEWSNLPWGEDLTINEAVEHIANKQIRKECIPDQERNLPPDPTDEVDQPEYACPTCGEVSDKERWHCQGCDGHFPMDVQVCPKCPGRPDEPPPPVPQKPFDVMEVVFKVRNFVDKLIPSCKGLKEADKEVLRQTFRQLANEV